MRRPGRRRRRSITPSPRATRTRAVALIARYWHAYVDKGRTATVCGWMRALGDDRIAGHPLAAHCAAWAAALSGDQKSVRRWLPVIEAGHHDGPLPDGMRSLESSAALLRASFGFDGLPVMLEAARTAATIERRPGLAVLRPGQERTWVSASS